MTGWLPVVATAIDARATENSRRHQCQLNLRNIALCVLQYRVDYDDKLPIATATDGKRWGAAYGWADATEPYYRDKSIYQCPSERHKPGSNPRTPGFTDYWYNRNLSGRPAEVVSHPDRTLLAGDGDGGSVASNAR
jgi:hypothetical protein